MKGSLSLYEAEFCALDLETTGVNPFTGKIVEIGIARFRLDRVIEQYESFVNPGCEIPEQVIKIHGITDEMVQDAPLIEELLDDITKFIHKSPLVIQNPRFDISFLEMAYKRAGRHVPQLIAYDTVTLARKTYKNLENYKLHTLCAHLGIEIQHHRALSDTLACMNVFRNVIKLNDKRKTWTFHDLNQFQGKIEKSGIIKELDFKECRKSRIVPGKVVEIRYRDAEGNVTERKILPKKIFKRGKQTIIVAYCYMRESERFFKTGRIESIQSC
jgi:DNA polymerase III epsilon subunit family exonuclease